jgi:hypothetical protein
MLHGINVQGCLDKKHERYEVKRCMEKPVTLLVSSILGLLSVACASVQICSARCTGRWMVDKRQTNGVIRTRKNLMSVPGYWCFLHDMFGVRGASTQLVWIKTLDEEQDSD